MQLNIEIIFNAYMRRVSIVAAILLQIVCYAHCELSKNPEKLKNEVNKQECE